MLAAARPTRRDALTVSIAPRASRVDPPHHRRSTADAPSWKRDPVGPVAFWRNRDNRVRVGLRFYVFFGVGVEPDLVALPVGLRFDVFAVASAKPTKRT